MQVRIADANAGLMNAMRCDGKAMRVINSNRAQVLFTGIISRANNCLPVG